MPFQVQFLCSPSLACSCTQNVCVQFSFSFFLGVYRSFSTVKDFPSQLQMGGESVSKGGVFVIYAILRKSTKSYLTSYKLEEAFFFFLDCGSPEGFDR